MSLAGTFLTGAYIDQPSELVGSTTDVHVAQRTTSGSSYSQDKGPGDAEKGAVDPPVYDRHVDEDDTESQTRRAFWAQYQPFILAIVAAIILGWWISSTILKATRHRW